MRDVYLGIDCGTTSIKCMAVDLKGEFLTISSQPHPTESPFPGWMEQDPDSWFEPTIMAIKKCLGALADAKVAGISFSGHMSSPVFLDANNNPLYPCMTVGDARCTEQTRYIYENFKTECAEISNNIPMECFVAPKILWFKENVPEAYEKTVNMVFAKDYIRYKLTGCVGTDVTDVGNTLLYDLEKQDWAWDFIDKLNIKRELFPVVMESTDVAGYLSNEIMNILGIDYKVPVICGGADMSCSQLGTMGADRNVLNITLSTSGQVCMRIDCFDEKGLGKVTFHPGPAKYWRYAMGSIFSGGLALNWCYQLFNPCKAMDDENLKKMSILAESISKLKPGSTGMMFLPFLTGSGTPHFISNDRGCLTGLSITSDQASIFKAVMEGVSLHILENVKVFEDMGCHIDRICLGGGGVFVPGWGQMIADVMDKKVSILTIKDSSTLGAALLAIKGVNPEISLEELSIENVTTDKDIYPRKEYVEKYKELFDVFNDFYDATSKINIRLQEIIEK